MIVSLGGLMVGSLVFYKSLKCFLFLNEIKSEGLKSKGKILSFKSDEDGYKIPIIEFETNDGVVVKGQPYYYVTSDSSFFQSFSSSIGKSIVVIYSPTCEDRFVIESEQSFNYLSLFFGIFISLIFIGISLASLFGFIII